MNIKKNNHKFFISENNKKLYNIICILEDNKVKYTVLDNWKGIILEPDDFFTQYKNLRNLLDGCYNEVLNTGDIISNPDDSIKEIVIKDNDLFISKYEDYFISPYTGNWYNNKEKGNLSSAVINYASCKKRNNYIGLSNSVRDILNFNLLRSDIYKFTKFYYKTRIPFFELLFSKIKLKFSKNGDQSPLEIYQNFINNNEFPRCVPWVDSNNNCGIWIWPERYFINFLEPKVVNVFPDSDIILNDIRLHNYKIKFNRENRCSKDFRFQFPEISNKYYVMTNKALSQNNPLIPQLVLLNNGDDPQSGSLSCYYKSCKDSGYVVTLKDYLNLDDIDKKTIKLILELIRDCGYGYECHEVTTYETIEDEECKEDDNWPTFILDTY